MKTPQDIWNEIEAVSQAEISWPIVYGLAGDGLWLEFGVGGGYSLRQHALHNPTRTIYGFDWFQGLPEDWGTGTECTKAGSYATPIPTGLPANAQLVIGLFQDTLDGFLAQHPGPVAFAHMDADLYSSTSYVLQKLTSRLRSGSVLTFDEIIGHPTFLDHEAKAVAELSHPYRCVGRLGAYQAAFQIL